jgi:hypothetical protein
MPLPRYASSTSNDVFSGYLTALSADYMDEPATRSLATIGASPTL